MASQVSEVAQSLASVNQPDDEADSSESRMLVSTAACLYCSKNFYCVHAVRERTNARHREVRRQKRLRKRLQATRTRPDRAPVVQVDSDTEPVELPPAPMFSPSAKGIGYRRVCRFWSNIVQRFQTQFADRHFDDNISLPNLMPKAQEYVFTEKIDLELRLGMPGVTDGVDGVDVTLKL